MAYKKSSETGMFDQESTPIKIRELIRKNKTDELDNYLDIKVKKYILENKLYND